MNDSVLNFDPAPPRGPASIAVSVCTYRRNEPLKRVLESLDGAAAVVQPSIEIAVVVVDDNPDGRARPIVEEFTGSFVLGLHYEFSGSENISVARNTGLELAMRLADWVAMIDDDQVADPNWLLTLADVQRATGADAVTGTVLLRYPSHAPAWILEQPFAEFFDAPIAPDRSRVDTCSTGNSLLRSRFLEAHPDLRFQPEFGRTGGEDMVFYRLAIAAGLDARFSTGSICHHEPSGERLTYRSQLRAAHWLGNSDFLTNHETGVTRARLTARAGRRLLNAARRPVVNLLAGKPPQWRFTGALLAHALGMLVGSAGIRIRHV
ncbi:MAG: glycosyltransferase family 2 protein [Acidimicrobiales bacterium]